MNTAADLKTIFIVGSNSFTNRMIAAFIEKESGYNCLSYYNFQDFKSNFAEHDTEADQLVLWDSQTQSLSDLWQTLSQENELWPERRKVAVFNAPDNSDIGVDILRHGGHGVFFQKDEPSILIKGIQCIFNGDLWVSRKVANRYIYRTRDRRRLNESDLLTNRETEILSWLPLGTTNEAIADSLNISPHTVRTHLSNIYNKLKVSNRFQAALWASENL